MVYVSHAAAEVHRIADHVIELDDGRVSAEPQASPSPR